MAGYEDLTEVAAGGFGVVYRARQDDLDRTVAIKVLGAGLDSRALARFDRERRTMGRLSGHPHIVTIHEASIAVGGRPYIVMEYLAAGSLADRLEREGPLGWNEAADMGIKLAGALDAAHRAGILHRDIKPENVLVSDFGEPKLGDFGIAQARDLTRTHSGSVTASVAHAAPEVLAGEEFREASDMYSLGSTLHALVAGAPAFVRASDESVLPIFARVVTEPVPDLRPRGVPDAFCRVLERAMAKDPVLRPTAAELADQLRAAIAVPYSRATRDPSVTVSVDTPAPRPSPGTLPPPRSREPHAAAPPAATQPPTRRRIVLAAGVAAALVLAGVVGVIVFRNDGSTGDDLVGADRTVTSVDAGGQPFDVAVTTGAAWVTTDRDSVKRIDPATNRVTATIEVGTRPRGVAADAEAVWVANAGSGTVSRISSRTNRGTATIEVGGEPFAVAASSDAVWVTDIEGNTVSRIDPSDNGITATIELETRPSDVAAAEDGVWVTHTRGDTVSRIDPFTDAVSATIAVGSRPDGVAVADGAVWVANLGDDTISRIDPATDTVTATIEVRDAPRDVAAGSGVVWVTSSEGDIVTRIDPATDTVTGTVEVGRNAVPFRLAAGDDAVWVTNLGNLTVSRIDPR
ncbi:MAG TPA: serine/threonine-protein kinase [Acidimicrobiia bacterium]|nr:serine/threonine-protein kinase [Acidimicrobiia bacterium]